MGVIPSGVIMVWTGTNASIPSGWQRETSMDTYYPKGEDTTPNSTSGSNTHTHTANTHGHTLVAHTHDVVLAHYSGPASASNRNDTSADNHGHVSAAIGGTSGGSLASEVESWQSVNHEPPYYKVIYIKPSGGTASIADDVCMFWNDATAPTGFNHCDGDNGTTDLRGKYLKGADASGDSGGTGGGTSHSHTITHTHAASGHTHSGNSGLRDNSGNRGIPGALTGSTQGHRHTVTLNSTSAGAGNSDETTGGSGDTVEVLYKKLAIVQNTSGSSTNAPLGAIGLWLGTIASIPAGWSLCDGTSGTPDLVDYYVKIITTTGQIGDSAGSNTHTHTAVSHSHTATGTHTHTGSTGVPDATLSTDTGGDGYSPSTHTHTMDSVSSETATWNDQDMDSGDAVSNEPAYITAAYIQMTSEIGGFFANMV